MWMGLSHTHMGTVKVLEQHAAAQLAAEPPSGRGVRDWSGISRQAIARVRHLWAVPLRWLTAAHAFASIVLLSIARILQYQYTDGVFMTTGAHSQYASRPSCPQLN